MLLLLMLFTGTWYASDEINPLGRSSINARNYSRIVVNLRRCLPNMFEVSVNQTLILEDYLSCGIST
ncbi:hypothetical protein KC19_1G312600 [Ceratodon purpureus]|uniref:Uncharacterized protein n=1 Tax=Ceratodon purpureus TaxID=3225 RepID=A0A8T0JED7_CERPU|nr:hypothetical protein KC19_1G312600 [Ceratodon purpureus]